MNKIWIFFLNVLMLISIMLVKLEVHMALGFSLAKKHFLRNWFSFYKLPVDNFLALASYDN